MTDVELWIWAGAGLAGGCVHVAMLWRAAQRVSHHTPWHAIGGLLRLGAIAALFVVAARAGQLLPTVGGWTAGFSVACVTTLLASSARRDET